MALAPTATRADALVRQFRAAIDDGLKRVVPHAAPERLYGPARYVLDGGGKRLRPLLLLLAHDAYRSAAAEHDTAAANTMAANTMAAVLPAALAVEVFHNFTLVHDDIMDHADTRRGRPTVHVRWSVDTAILAGDYLMGLAYELLARVETPLLGELIHRLHAMMTALCEGQTLDKDFETRTDVTVADYLHMIDRKTGALLQAALAIGGRLGGATLAEADTLRRLGHDLGRAFQIQDDLLDLTAEDTRWGKAVGGDLVEGKKTFLLLRALERTTGAEQAWFARITQGGLPAEEVPEARLRMDRLGVLDDTRQAVSDYTATAFQGLRTLPETPARAALAGLIEQLQVRAH